MVFSKICFLVKGILTYFHQKYILTIARLKSLFLWNYYYNFIPEPKVYSPIRTNSQIQNEIKNLLLKNDFNVIDYKINIIDYKSYLKNAKYNKYTNYSRLLNNNNSFFEKTLEHYLATKFLHLSEDDIYIDIASSNSPTSYIYNNLFGCNVYRQDLSFPKGIHGKTIGGDATNMPIKDGFATKMALHCSFEHFEKKSDVKFIKEASRVLKKGGKLCILPLYLFNKYSIQIDPSALPKKRQIFENDAILYCTRGTGIRHGRFYDVSHLITRIRNNLNDLKLTIYFIQNEKKIDPNCYIKFIALFEKL